LIELNKIYKMDNLELLNELPNNYIDLIYSDILFNTGRKFKDYNDNLGTPQQAIEWYRPRIEGMYRVLKDTGSIYLHMDYRLVHYMKVLMDEIFGFDNFRNEIVWKRSNGHNLSKKEFINIIDYILKYSKSNNYIHNILYDKLSDLEIKNKFPYLEIETGRYYNTDKLEKSSNSYNKNEIRIINNKKFKTTLGWVWTQKELDIRLLNNKHLIYITKNNKPRYKNYADEYKGKLINNIWDDINNISNSKERIGYDTQKPKLLLERIIKSSSNENDIVLDLFCGSGTTMVAAKELGRKFIGCDISERAIEISEKRLMEVEIDGSEGKVSECVG